MLLRNICANIKFIFIHTNSGHNPGKTTRLKVKHCDDDTSSLSQSSESDDSEANCEELEHHGVMVGYSIIKSASSPIIIMTEHNIIISYWLHEPLYNLLCVSYLILLYLQDICDDDNRSEQSEASADSLQDSVDPDSQDKFTSSPMESAQECWLGSDPAHQNALKQQSNEDDTEAQSDTKSSTGSLQIDDASLKQSELGESDTKPPESEDIDSSLKQSDLAIGDDHEAQSDTKLSDSLENDDSLLKQNELGGEAQSDLSGSLESDDASLKQSKVEAGESTAKKKRRSVLDSISKLARKITRSKQKRKDSTSKHEQSETPTDSPAVADIGKVFIARYAYRARTAEDLSFEKGEQLIVSCSVCLCHVACNNFCLIADLICFFAQVIGSTDGDWWMARSSKTNHEGYIPSNYVAPLTSYEAEE